MIILKSHLSFWIQPLEFRNTTPFKQLYSSVGHLFDACPKGDSQKFGFFPWRKWKGPIFSPMVLIVGGLEDLVEKQLHLLHLNGDVGLLTSSIVKEIPESLP